MVNVGDGTTLNVFKFCCTSYVIEETEVVLLYS